MILICLVNHFFYSVSKGISGWDHTLKTQTQWTAPSHACGWVSPLFCWGLEQNKNGLEGQSLPRLPNCVVRLWLSELAPGFWNSRLSLSDLHWSLPIPSHCWFPGFFPLREFITIHLSVFIPLWQLLQIHPFAYPPEFVSQTTPDNKNPYHLWWGVRVKLIYG